MPAYVQDVVTFTTTTGNKTATITPAVNGLLVVFVALSTDTGVVTVSDDRGGTYSQVVKTVRSGGASEGWWYVRDQLVTVAAAHIVTLTTDGLDAGGGLDVIEVSGMNAAGLGAIRQSAHTDGIAAGGTDVVTFAQACLTGNTVLVAITSADNPTTPTTPTSYTQRRNVGFTVPAAGMQTNTRDSGETTTTVTWGGTSTGASGTAGLELNADARTMPQQLTPKPMAIPAFNIFGPPILTPQYFEIQAAAGAPIVTADTVNMRASRGRSTAIPLTDRREMPQAPLLVPLSFGRPGPPIIVEQQFPAAGVQTVVADTVNARGRGRATSTDLAIVLDPATTKRARGRSTATALSIVIAPSVSNRRARGRATASPSDIVIASATTRRARGTSSTSVGLALLDVGQNVPTPHVLSPKPGPPLLIEQWIEPVASITPVVTAAAVGRGRARATSTDVVIVLASATTRRARGTSSASPGLPLLDVGQNVPTPLAAFGQGRMAQGPPELAQQRFADWGVAASGTSRARGRMTATSTNIVIAATVSNRGARGRSTSTPSVFVQAIGTTRKARGYATATGASILDVGQYVAPAHLFGGRPGPPILREQEFTQGVATPVITGSANGRGRARGTASSTCIVFASATTKRARGRGTSTASCVTTAVATTRRARGRATSTPFNFVRGVATTRRGRGRATAPAFQIVFDAGRSRTHGRAIADGAAFIPVSGAKIDLEAVADSGVTVEGVADPGGSAVGVLDRPPGIEGVADSGIQIEGVRGSGIDLEGG